MSDTLFDVCCTLLAASLLAMPICAYHGWRRVPGGPPRARGVGATLDMRLDVGTTLDVRLDSCALRILDNKIHECGGHTDAQLSY